MLYLVYLVNSLNSAIRLRKSSVIITKFNSLTLAILKILQKLNIIESFLINPDFTKCTVFFNNIKSDVLDRKIICISKPNRYIYYSINDLIHLRSIDTYNDYIISINNKNSTIINIDDAIRLHKGGLLLLHLFLMESLRLRELLLTKLGTIFTKMVDF